MAEGVIHWWNVDRGWGFVRAERGPDVFVHHAALDDDCDLRAGDRISFDAVPGYVGTVASNISRL